MPGLLDRIRAAKNPTPGWPGNTAALASSVYGHDDSEFSPESYGDYVVTSNEVYSVVNYRARMMSTLDLRLYDGRGANRKEITAGPAVDLLDRVNPYWTWRRLRRMDELCMCLWGESYWALEPGATGEPATIWWLKPSRVTPVPAAKKYLKGFLYQPADGGDAIPFAPDEIVWFRYPNPLDEFSALSPLAAARLAADTGAAMMRSNRNLFTNGMQLGGVLMPTKNGVSYTDGQAKDLERALERRFKGVDKAHRWAVLRFEAQLAGVGISPKDAEFVSGLDLTLRQVANAYGLPAPLVNDLAHATLANTREFERIAWAHTLVPDSQLYADEIKEQFLTRFRQRVNHCEFDYTKVPALQESATETWTREAQAMDRGAITINEWRKEKGKPPVPWGEVPYMAVNKAPVDPDTGLLQTADQVTPTPGQAGEATAWRHIFDSFAALTNGHH